MGRKTTAEIARRKDTFRRKWIDHRDEVHDKIGDQLARAHMRGLIDLEKPVAYRPGSREKLSVMAARRIVGLPLFVDGDLNHNEACVIHCTTLPLDRPTYAACRILEVLE
jgi:hypothetical protein